MGAILALVILAAGVVFIGGQLGYIPSQSSVQTQQTQSIQGSGCYAGYTPPSGWLCTTLPLKLSLNDPLPSSGNAIASATIRIIDPLSLGTRESPATGSDGTVTTSNVFTTGESFVCYSAPTNFVTMYQPCFVPPIASTAAQVTSINVPLYDIRLGVYSTSASVTGGTTWTSTFSSYSFANTALDQIVASFTETETTNNAGYISTYNIVDKVNLLMCVEFNDGAAATATFDGYQYYVKVGTTSYYIYCFADGFSTISNNWALKTSGITSTFAKDLTGRYVSEAPDQSQVFTHNGITASGSSSMQLAGNTAIGGSVTFQLTMNKGSMTAGGTVTLQHKLYRYYDPVYFLAFGNGGPAAAQVGSTLTITLRN